MRKAVNEVARAFLLVSRNKVYEKPKYRLSSTIGLAPFGMTASAAQVRSGSHVVSGFKMLTSGDDNSRKGFPRSQGVTVLTDKKNGAPLAILDAKLINAMRTGAMTALAARALTPTVQKAALIGAGAQMRTQLLGLRYALPHLKEVTVFSRGKSRQRFAEDMAFLGLKISPVSSLDVAIADAELIVIAASDDCEPIIAALPKNTSVAVFSIGHFDVSEKALMQFDRIVTDSWELLKARTGHVITKSVSRKKIKQSMIEDLGDLLLKKSKNGDKKKNIFFSPGGLASLDIVLADSIYKAALKKKVGTYIAL